MKRSDIISVVALITLGVGFLTSFFQRTEVGAIFFEGRIQRGSTISWSMSGQMIPMWSGLSITFTAQRLSGENRGSGSHIIHLFTNSPNVGEMEGSTIRLFTNRFELSGNTLFDARVNFAPTGTVQFDGYQTFISLRQNQLIHLWGRVGEAFQLQADAAPLAARWGELPHMMTASYPPIYADDDQARLIQITLEGSSNGQVGNGDGELFMRAEGVSEKNLNQAVTVAELSGNGSAALFILGNRRDMGPNDLLSVTFSSESPGQLQVSRSETVTITGTPESIYINQSDARPRSINHWP